MAEQRPAADGDYVEVEPDVYVFCRHAGMDNPGPPLVFLHGTRDNHTHFAQLETAFAPRYRTVALDFRGHGLSSMADVPLSQELLAQDLDRVIHRYGWEQVVLVGHSLGGGVAMLYARDHPERVAALVLMGSAAHHAVHFKGREDEVPEEAFAAFLRQARTRAAPLFFHDKHPEVQRRVSSSWMQISHRVHRNLVSLARTDLREDLGRLTMPVLVLTGADDRCTTVADAQFIHERVPNSELCVVPDTAHFAYLENPTLVIERIEAFLVNDAVRGARAAAVKGD